MDNPHSFDELFRLTPAHEREIQDQHCARDTPRPPNESPGSEAKSAPLTPAEREARDRELLIDFLRRMQEGADEALRSFRGIDRPMRDGRPGREHEIVCESAIEFYRSMKETYVEEIAAYRNGKPLPW